MNMEHYFCARCRRWVHIHSGHECQPYPFRISLFSNIVQESRQ